jgi:hypothetical protein
VIGADVRASSIANHRFRRTDEETPMTAPDTAGPDLANRRRFTVAAFRATRRYPGPAGTVLARELLAWADFGYRLGADRPLMALVDDLLETTDAAAA